ncbi:MAG: hypothetical protein LC642_07240 [Verrucomicrobiaceae bacterium]|nr:hypothetical protein [Verrucomicrobiaceae bacterium]
MNGTEPKIEIFAPFGAAYEWMKTVLFRPFDLGKWLVIAFAAFISGSWGGGPNFNFPGGGGDWKYKWSSHENAPDWSLPAWGIALIVLGALLVLVIIVVLMWVNSRGRFIFTDCVVKNRAAIAEPWREYRREGNSFFLFLLAIGFVSLVLAGIFFLIIAVPLGFFSDNQAAAAGFGATAIVSFIIIGLIWLVVAIFVALVTEFMVPVMYRRRCSAKDAFLDVTRLVFRHPGEFVLFVLFGIVLAIAVVVVGILIACMTCCIGGLPYISTVLLLPAIVWLLAFKLFFLRQFGDQYDVWATVGFPEPPAPPPPATPPVSDPPAPVR